MDLFAQLVLQLNISQCYHFNLWRIHENSYVLEDI